MTTRNDEPGDLQPEPRVRLLWEPRDWWVGLYIGQAHLYICLLPTAVIRIRRRAERPTRRWWRTVLEWAFGILIGFALVAACFLTVFVSWKLAGGDTGTETGRWVVGVASALLALLLGRFLDHLAAQCRRPPRGRW